MNFAIENTPENSKRLWKKEKVQAVEQEERPRLILAPFSRPPQVVFDDVLVGTTCEKKLKVFNPLKHAQQITLCRPLPPGVVIHLPDDWLEVEPETCFFVSMTWTPTQLVSKRDTVRFNTDNRGHHNIIIVMKSIEPTKKPAQPKFTTSPGKIKKKTLKRSLVYKKRMEAVRSSVTVKSSVDIVESTQSRMVNATNKENSCFNDFQLPSSSDFNTSEVFSDIRSKVVILHDTYDKLCGTSRCEKPQLVSGNIRKPSNNLQQPTQWLTGNPAHVYETPVMNKKIPNTLSSKHMESQTFTKDSPNTPVDYRLNKNKSKFRNLASSAKKPYPKMCRPSLSKEQQNFEKLNETTPSHLRAGIKSRSQPFTPLESISEESMHFSDTQALDKTDKQFATCTTNQTFDKPSDLSSVSTKTLPTCSKSAVRAEPAFWQIPAPVTRKTTKRKANITSKSAVRAEPAFWQIPAPVTRKTTQQQPKANITMKESLSDTTNITQETNKSISQSSYLNYVGNVFSQASNVDPFLSSTFYYDKKAVENFQEQCKRWLNYVLTPPADLDSNIDQKIDVGEAWIENQNKEVPLAPTKEQVSIKYHNSKRLESLRRSAQELLLSPEISQVFNKLQAHLEKKSITIRNDKNLHLDIGLQIMILNIILCYNPLWLRIGLETIYNVVLPLQSNNDIKGLSTFIIQRMFKNPFLKNKHSKTAAPNMLRPAYMQAIKKFTLKKFFMLVFFLDQAKQKKIIPHDPCLFCRNAPFKESKAIIINFMKELIAGIGDITQQLQPLGYVVSHEQSYLDEFTFAVHNIDADIRDGIRLTKVMEIILMRSGLMHQLRTPAISRIRKRHNVQVALNALKEANFDIVGDISAADIANGHREKTLSLLWQLIHVFRAPLFEKAANVIQAWWRKKYQLIIVKRKEEERLK